MATSGVNFERQIFVIDDDPAVRETLSLLLSNAGYKVVCFADGNALLSEARTRSPSAIILDVHIPGKSGLDILKQLNADDYPAPIFIMSGKGDISMAVDSIKNGAHDFLEKPFRGSEVITRITEAVNARSSPRAKSASSPSINFPGREPLTGREQEVLHCLIQGASNKEVGRLLGISPRTVEVHRARIMEKTGTKNSADLIRAVMERRGS